MALEGCRALPKTYLHYSGLESNQSSWFCNRVGDHVQVFPGEWVAVDLDAHPELYHVIEQRIAVTHGAPPEDVEVLDENTDRDRRRTEYGKIIAKRRPRGRPRKSEGRSFEAKRYFLDGRWLTRREVLSELYALGYETLVGIMDTLLPKKSVDDFFDNCEGWMHFSVGPGIDNRGASEAHGIRPERAPNFLAIYRIAELLCRKQPESNASLLMVLREFGVWKRDELPTASTMSRYRERYGISPDELDVTILRFADEIGERSPG